MADNEELVRTELGSHPYNDFRPLNTIWVAFLQMVLLLSLQIVALSFAFIWTDTEYKCDIFYLIVYGQVCLWVIYFALRFYLSYIHRMNLKAEGYFKFYEESAFHIDIPLYVTSAWIGLLALAMCMYNGIGKNLEIYCERTHFVSPIHVVAIMIVLENLILAPVFTGYMIKVYEFNKKKSAPDDECDQLPFPGTLQESFSAEIGCRQRAETVDKMLQKQTDLIHYYKEANEKLNKKVLDLATKLRALGSAE